MGGRHTGEVVGQIMIATLKAQMYMTFTLKELGYAIGASHETSRRYVREMERSGLAEKIGGNPCLYRWIGI